ncbi:MAG TPA: RNA polymerase sigma factor [Bacteroidales bacterium]|nr:RNA polymerase sigma factor [Bacteroidales bacterium]
MNDQELVKAVIRGDNNAMRHLISRYQDLVLNTCYKVLQSREDAEDIAQDVFIETFRSVASLRNEQNISFWLYRISLNKSINHIKRSQNILFRSIQQIESIFRHDNPGGAEPVPHSEDNPGERMEAVERQQMLSAAVASLSARQQKAFILYYYEEMSYKEISAVLGLSVSSVESLLSRGRENVRKKCCPDYPDNKEIKT